VDLLIDEVNTDDYAALAISGGFEAFGFYDHANDEKFLQLISTFKKKENYRLYLCRCLAYG